MLSFKDLMKRLQDCVIVDDQGSENVRQKLRLLSDKLFESSRFVSPCEKRYVGNVSATFSKCLFLNRSSVKRSKERCLEEGIQLLRQISEAQLGGLEESLLLLLVRLLLSMQLQMVDNSTACRKVDQVGPRVSLSYCKMLKAQFNFTEAEYLF